MPNSRAIHDQHAAPRPLAVIREQFARLAGHPVAGLPPGWEQMKAADLAERLLYQQVPADEVDAVWASLIQQARTQDEAAVLVCAGAALPMLHSITAVLCGHWLHRADTESMVILGFLEALADSSVKFSPDISKAPGATLRAYANGIHTSGLPLNRHGWR